MLRRTPAAHLFCDGHGRRSDRAIGEGKVYPCAVDRDGRREIGTVARKRNLIDNRRAAVGFCFGGGKVLELAPSSSANAFAPPTVQ